MTRHYARCGHEVEPCEGPQVAACPKCSPTAGKPLPNQHKPTGIPILLGEADRLLLPKEVAAIFRVDPKTVSRWVNAGRLDSTRTPGGHRRISESAVRALLAGEN